MNNPKAIATNSNRKGIKIFLVCYVLIFLGIIGWGFLPQIGFLRYFVDGFSINQRAVNAQLRFVLWEEPNALPGRINDIRSNTEATISSDGTLVVFAHKFSHNNYDLYYSTLRDGSWTTPKPLNGVNSAYNDRSPELSKDGQFLYFYSNKPKGFGGNDIWMSHKAGLAWTKAINLGVTINTAYDEVDPAISPDGLSLFVSSNKPHTKTEKSAVKKEKALPRTDFDIYRSFVEIKGYNTPPDYSSLQNVKALNSNYDDGKVAVSLRGDILYFNSNRPEGFGGFDIYSSRLFQGEYMDPVNFGAPVNSIFDEINPTLTMDGYRILFSSNRKSRTRQDFTIYDSKSRDVLVQVDYDMLQNLILLGLLLLLLIASIYYILQLFLGQNDMKTLSKCLLASLLLHLLLAALSGSMYLTSEMTSELQDGPEEMTININNLARESIAMSIREGVESLPKVNTSTTTSQQTSEMQTTTSEPQTTQSEQTVDNSTAVSESTFAEIAMSEVVNEANTEPTASEMAAVEPMILGSTSMEMEARPAGAPNVKAAKKGSAQGLPSATKSKKRRESLKLSSSSMEASPKQTQESASQDSQSASTDKSSAPPSFDDIGKSSTNAAVSGQGKSANAQSTKAAGAAFASKSFASSLGFFKFKNFLKMEEKMEEEKIEDLELGLLEVDPRIAEILAIYIPGELRKLLINELKKDYMRNGNIMSFSDFSALDIVKKSDIINRSISSLIYKNTPGLQIPVDSELDVPEKYLN